MVHTWTHIPAMAEKWCLLLTLYLNQALRVGLGNGWSCMDCTIIINEAKNKEN